MVLYSPHNLFRSPKQVVNQSFQKFLVCCHGQGRDVWEGFFPGKKLNLAFSPSFRGKFIIKVPSSIFLIW